jgi:hypothetical protein
VAARSIAPKTRTKIGMTIRKIVLVPSEAATKVLLIFGDWSCFPSEVDQGQEKTGIKLFHGFTSIG